MRTWLKSLFTPLTLLGLALFLVPWLWVMRAPETRSLFTKQVTGNAEMPPAPPWAGSLPYPYGSRGNRGLDAIPDSLGVDYPNDPQVQAKLAEQAAGDDPVDPNGGTPRFAQMRVYPRLIKRFPRESWLYARFLADAVSSFNDQRIGGVFSSSAVISMYANAPESTGQPPNFSVQQLNEALSIARQAQKVEPDNAYFGLCEGILLWMGHRDTEAWRALHRASLLPRYDEHCYDDAEAAIAVTRKWRGPLLWEEQYMFSGTMRFPQYAQFREKARQWSWAAWKLERTGQHQDAITKRADLARLFGKIMHGRNTLIGGMVGQAIQAIMWGGNPNRKVNVSGITWEQRVSTGMKLRSQKFANYARAHGEPAVATESIRLGQETATISDLTHQSIANFSANNFRPDLLYQTRALWWLACGLLISGSMVFAVWLFSFALLIGAKSERAKARFVGPVVVLCFVTTSLIYGKCNGAAIESLFSYANTPSATLRLFIGVMQVGAFFLPLLLPALVCAIPTWWRLRKVRRGARQQDHSHLPRDMRPLVWSFAGWCALITTVLGWVFAARAWDSAWTSLPQDFHLDLLGFAMTLRGESLPLQITVVASLASFFLLCGWLLRWRFFLPSSERPFAHSALRRFNTVLGVLLIVGTWSYAFTLYATLAPRREADRLSDIALQQGEIGSLEAQNPQLFHLKGKTP